MKTKYIFIVITLFLGKITIAQTVFEGEIDRYPGKAGALLAGSILPEPFGNIKANGTFTVDFKDSYFNKVIQRMEEAQNKQPGSVKLATFKTPFTCKDDGFTFMNGDQPIITLLGFEGFMVGNLKEKKLFGKIKLLSSEDFGQSQVFQYQKEPKTGYMIDWYYVEKAAKVGGSCITVNATGNGDETYKRKVTLNLNLHPGWNLVQYEISKVFTGKSGDKFIQNASYSSLDKVPEDVKYIYSKK
jgi:hypothetical protein